MRPGRGGSGGETKVCLVGDGGLGVARVELEEAACVCVCECVSACVYACVCMRVLVCVHVDKMGH